MNANLLRLSTTGRRRQRGAASLFVALMLLLGGTIIAFFANRGFIFEQRTSANQYRATKAFELAEAGAEWALGKLNENMLLTSTTGCTAATTAAGAAASFRDRYASPTAGSASAAGSFVPQNDAVPGCRISATGVANCDCPSAAGDARTNLASNPEEGRFSVRIRSGGDPSTVEILSRGCSNGTGACDPTDQSTAAGADSTAVVRILAKVVPAVPAGPAAALTAGSATVISGSLDVVNHDQASNGITIHSGTTVNLDGSTTTRVHTLFGTPPQASVLDNDPSLADLTNASADAFFANYFGQTLTSYRDTDPDVIRIGPNETDSARQCNNAGSCGDRVRAIANAGVVRNPRFYVYGDVSFNAGTLGSSSNPMVLVAGPSTPNGTDGEIRFTGNIVAHGLFYAATATATENWDPLGGGNATIYGAFVSRGSFNVGTGNLRLIYTPGLWGNSAPPIGRLVRVPGSWRDKLTEF